MGKHRVAVVTGGGRGIGRGIVESLAALGMEIVVNYRSDAAAAEVVCRAAEALGAPRAVAIRADISEPEQGRRLVETVKDRQGRIDLWVNNAGVAPAERLDLLETSPESWDRVLATNLRGPFFLTQAVARAMIEFRDSGIAHDPQIVFITSISSNTASVNRGEYCVSKAGLSMVAQLFAVRLAGQGVQVHEVRPGLIATDMTSEVRELYDRKIAEGLVPIPRWGLPEDVGKAVAALASGALPYSTGSVINIDGGMQLRRL